MGSAVLTNSIATTVSQGAPTVNQDGAAGLGTRTGGIGDAIAYIYFPRPFPLAATILSAKIKFYTTSMTSATHTFNFQRLNQSFSASAVTWNTRPTSLIAGVKPVTKTGVIADKTEWEVDITDWMQTVANGGVWYGIQFMITEAVARWVYSEINPAVAYRPRLEITWSDAPANPTGLSPSGGRAVGLAKPVVRATYLDVSGATALQSVQVQINATDVWTSPTFDSGTVATSVPELDLASTAYAGLADAVTTFWRIRFQDAAGLWSPWSASTSFKRDDKGTLSVTNPPSGTPKVEDSTPPIIWTFSGETQAAYQIQIRHSVNGVQVIDWDSGKVTSAALSVTVPTGTIKETGVTYTVTVRIWDTKQREATPNDPTYVEVIRDFTFIPGATTGTASLVAVAQDPRPAVVLTWQRATAPDKFNVLRNGKVIAAGLLPDAPPIGVFLSGTTYQWTDNSPSPGRSLTYSVQAVVNSVASATNATAVVTVRSIGSWLRDPSTGLELCITGRDERDFILGEQSAVLQAIAPNANKIPINQSLGGLEGRVEGDLIDIHGLTAQQWRDQFLQLRALRVKQFYFTEGDSTFLVVAQDFHYSQRRLPTPLFRVSFTVYQQDDVNKTLPLGS
jgi:hypothetical protein